VRPWIRRKKNKKTKRGRNAAEKRGQREPGDREHEQALATEIAGEPAGQRQDHGIRDEVRSKRPRRFFRRGRQASRDMRQRYVDHRRVENFQERRKHYRNGDDPRINVRMLRRRCRGGLGFQAYRPF